MIAASGEHRFTLDGNILDYSVDSAAAEAGCSVVLTEDMADGTRLAGVEIHKPFAPAGGLTERTRALFGG